MSDAATDFYHKKTDAELLFFVEHPDYYQETLVDAARRELRRRGVAPTAPLAAAAPLPEIIESKPWGKIVGLGLGLLVLGGGTYFLQQRSSAQEAALQARQEAKRRLPPPRLVEVATSAIPNYDGVVAQTVAQQLRKVPTAEKANAQHLRQYRELAKRFWTAQTKTEYVLDKARQGKFDAALVGHIESVEAAWEPWRKATVYGYKLGPVMATHLDLMTRVANQQQEGLADLYLVARNPQPFENEKTERREADVSDLLSGLLPKSPVTGRAYNTMVRRVQL
ncbi:hypothetical protein I2I05_20075 [Hymenobacter sp. BT683]|uniref:Uncharacterized protein n=1 Tax=Hymenobacter jeongseonensis TaxID=2791027 RepID=A0ABS0IMW0_9BACT|nr:hypothetical protein [Hymenobacter jeongseonensis]MBF9239701.1 hypothetical protein [Hymenobacter jeongseonensis]